MPVANCDAYSVYCLLHFRNFYRFLATGDSCTSLGYSYRIHKSTLSHIILDTCNAIWNVLQPEVMPVPTTEDWKRMAEEYEKFWQFPNCCSSIDGKHVLMQAPSNAGSMYFNYKRSHSIVLVAVVDAFYNFVMIDVGAHGKDSDGRVFANSTFGTQLKHGTLNFPPPTALSGNIKVPHVFVGDEAFPLLKNLMRPYPGPRLAPSERIFNYRLSRARRIVENAFGIMAAKFRVFRRTLFYSNQKVSNRW